MSTATARTPKAAAVLAAASELFYAHGIHAVGVDAIAERAGVTKKTLYDRFGSKERLVVEYLTERDREWREFLRPRLEIAGADPVARLRAVFDASAAWAAERGGKGCSMINAHAEISDPAHPAYAVLMHQKAWMLGLFRDIAAASVAASPGEVAAVVMLLHEGALVAGGMSILAEPYLRARDAAERLLGPS
jgi:AcrR family transcriptional regulator